MSIKCTKFDFGWGSAPDPAGAAYSTSPVSEVAPSQPVKPARKQNLTRNSQRRSFKVMHLGVTEKPTTDCILPYYNAGLISKVSEKIASENAKIAVVDNPTVVWSPLLGEPQRIFAEILYRQKLESLAYIFVADSMGLSSFKFLWLAPKDASFLQHSAYRPFKVILGRWFRNQSKGRMRLPISH